MHEYKGYGVHPSKCGVHIIREDGFIFVVFEDLNQGTSVTNASEQLATEVVEKCNLNPEECIFLETYGDDLDQIQYSWDGKRAYNPNWCMMDKSQLAILKNNLELTNS